MNMAGYCSALVLVIFLLASPLTGQASAVIPGDFDADGDVDLADFAAFQTCALGAGIAQTAPECTDARLDVDQDVDLGDFAVFRECFSGAGNPADPNCACPSGQTNCDGTCMGLQWDNANCGSCGNACSFDMSCVAGFCEPQEPCPDCRGSAVIIPGDFDADGDVDLADFAEFQTCFLGPASAQTDPACTDARLDADQDVDLDDFKVFQGCLSGAENPADPNCACPSGQTNCDGTCTSTASDEANCGNCGNICGTGLVCQNGSCATCPAGTFSCGASCVGLDNDLDNCGSCGHSCEGGEECYGGECHPAEPCGPECGGGGG